MGHDDLARLAGRQHVALRVDDLDDDVLGRDVHAALGTLVGDEAGVASAVAVRDAAAERARDRLPLVVVEALGRHERDLDAEVVEPLSPTLGVAAMCASADG